MGKILVVDDDRNLLKLIRLRLEAEGHEVATVGQAEGALQLGRREPFDLAVVDYKLEGVDGVELMEGLLREDPELPVIILTAYGTIRGAVEAMKRGAWGYLAKPFEDDEFLMQVHNALSKSRLSREVKRLRNLVQERYGFENILGKSERMQRVLDQAAQAAATDSVVLLKGESGTGKELIARALHVAGSRREGPFVAVNCAAIPETLLESELFGYEPGAFTGADRSKKGFFALAHRGTLFLDEISEMALTMQAKVLRVLEGMEFYPLGSAKTVKVDVRIIAATNRDLEEEVKKEHFRQDLFYRIHVIPIQLPPLRERKEDIPVLARHFLKQYSEKMKRDIEGFSPAALRKLLSHDWPGNVRELENAVEGAVAMCTAKVITDDLLLPTRDADGKGLRSLKEAKQDFERDYLVQLVELTGGNVSQAAKLSGKHRADLYELLRKHNLDPGQFRK
ncbi:MAG: sigma-54 dependent transcriptional regulator [Thermodesulfobacteriota bacterium]